MTSLSFQITKKSIIFVFNYFGTIVETMEPVGFCEHIRSPLNDFFGDDDDW